MHAMISGAMLLVLHSKNALRANQTSSKKNKQASGQCYCSCPSECFHTVLDPRNALALFLPLGMLSYCSHTLECSLTVLAHRNALTLSSPFGMFSYCSRPSECSHTVLAFGMFLYCFHPVQKSCPY